MTAYVATKFALRGISRSAAIELARLVSGLTRFFPARSRLRRWRTCVGRAALPCSRRYRSAGWASRPRSLSLLYSSRPMKVHTALGGSTWSTGV